jgi:hypothetical protein
MIGLGGQYCGRAAARRLDERQSRLTRTIADEGAKIKQKSRTVPDEVTCLPASCGMIFQHAIGKRSGVHTSHVSNIQRHGKRPISLGYLRAVASPARISKFAVRNWTTEYICLVNLRAAARLPCHPPLLNRDIGLRFQPSSQMR